jgi:hypothetical protein
MMLPRRYLHLGEGILNWLTDIACSSEFERYAGDSLAAGRATLSGQVLSKVQDKERYPGLPGWGLGFGLTSAPHKNSPVLKPQQQGGQGPKMGSIVVGEKEEDHI